MTSVFGIRGKARARALIRSMAEIVEEAEDSDGDGEEEGAFPLFGMRSACRIDPVEFAKQLSQGLEELLADPDLTDEAVLKLSQDYVREVTAHEVGHVLGLRHNFAGKWIRPWLKSLISNTNTILGWPLPRRLTIRWAPFQPGLKKLRKNCTKN